jgi:SAM-dependent methyltransferase
MDHDYTDAYANLYDIVTNHKDYGAEVNLLVSYLEKEGYNRSSRILSIGCGTASHELMLASHFELVVGFDRALPMIERARAKSNISNLCLHNASLDDLPFENFDVVILLFNVLNCIKSAELDSIFESISRKLRKGGLLIAEVWNADETIRIPPKEVSRLYENDNVNIVRLAVPSLDIPKSHLLIEYYINGFVDGRPIDLYSKHNIFLHSRQKLQSCLENISFGPVAWYTSLSDGLKPATEQDRMLLLTAGHH